MGKKRKRPGKENNGGLPSKRSTTHSAECHTHPVLSQYYPRLVTLRQYLLQQLPSSSKARRRRIASLNAKAPFADPSLDPQKQSIDNDSIIADLLDSTLVGVLKESNQSINQARQRDFAAFTQSEERSLLGTDTGPTCPQSEIVDFVIATLFKRVGLSYHKPQHVLANGYQRAAARQLVDRNIGAMASSIPGVVPQYPNHHVATLKTAPWTDVLALLGKNGDEIMVRLLLGCGVFCCLDRHKAVYYQLSGVPLSELEPVDKPVEKPLLGGDLNQTDVLHKPNSIIFVRRRMLYARPTLNARGEVRFGLRHIHVLNRYPSPSDLSHSVHVMKYIFPRQFGLHNVFTSVVDTRETVQPLKDYTLREDEIARRDELKRLDRARNGSEEEQQKEKTKLPKRLRGKALALVQQMQRRNQRCAYTELVRHYCPIDEIGPARLGAQPEPSSSMEAAQFVTQIRLPSQLSGPRSATQSQQNETITVASSSRRNPTLAAKQKPCLTDHATPASSVSAFCRAALQRLIPRAFFGVGEGGVANERIVMKQVDRFIRMSRFESLSLHEVCRGLQITCIPWLEPPNVQAGAKLALSDLRKRTEILHEFIYYIFDSLLIPLIRSNFYVTESQVHRNRLFYFRHDVWRRLTEKPLADIKSSMFEEIKRDRAQRILARRSLGYSALRLLPKAAGVRPITNLRRRMVKTAVFQNGKKTFLGPSINSLVTPIFSALSYEKTRKPEMLGSAMFSVDDMYPRLKAFKEKLTLRAGAGHPPHLFFAKLDIQSCFDTIPQNKLLAVVEKLMSEEALYHVTKHVEVRPTEGYNSRLSREEPGRQKFIRKFVSKAVSASEIGSGPTAGIANKKRNTVFVDTPAAKNHDTDNLLYLLEEHVRNNLVKIGKKYFRQRNGIPQGSVLSSLLCNFFYGELERELLGFLHCEDALLLRLIDDFLLITSRVDLAQRFLQVMMDGQPDYGISVNPSKSLVNFEATINGTKMPRLEGSSFPYCGSLIDTHTLDLRKDRNYGGATQVSDTLTVERNRVPGRIFHRKVLASFKMQTHTRFLDTEHNASKVVLAGIYTNFVETAIKMYRYFKSLPPRTRPSPDLVMRTIRDLIRFATSLIQSKRRQTRPTTSARIDCPITPLQIEHLGAAAFCHVLSRKQTQFSSVLRFLEQLQRATRPETDREALQMKRVTREGNAVFDGWRY